ncbi:MAG: Na+/H+ antiporter NhaA, partial [Bacteroidales bacterium]|nr:Na+/H+ antiporter NhaA [Bacteroidales bacterium]
MPATTLTNYSFISTFKKYVNSSVVLIFFTVLALVCANIPAVKDWYFSLWVHEVSLSIGNFNFFSHNGHTMNVGQVINDFLMAIFFLSVGLEIKREIRVGEL